LDLFLFKLSSTKVLRLEAIGSHQSGAIGSHQSGAIGSRYLSAEASSLEHRKSPGWRSSRKSPVRRSHLEVASSAQFIIVHHHYMHRQSYLISGMSESKTHVPKLEADNYYAWSYHMDLRPRKLDVWTIVDGQEPHPSGSNNHNVVKGWVTRMELALNEIISVVGDSQLVHTRVSMDPSVVWERLASIHMSQGLGSIISMWQRFFQLKKLEGVTVQAHAASIHEHADRLTGLGDSPSETLMVAVLLLSLPESFGSLVVSLDTHPDCTNFDFVVQLCINEEACQLSNVNKNSKHSQNVAFHADGKPRRDKKDVTCYKCGKKGHYRNECTEKEETPQEKSKEAAVVANEDFTDSEW
jgi:gag-polypeptide of LTR copia-type/Zinc knuckle